ncbi:MAG: T9SS type A sorting domain-containing protein, partial [Bacteroidota bacterium]
PNPATDLVSVSVEHGEELDVRIFAGDGRLVASGHSADGSIRFALSDWSPGIYLLQARAGERIWRRALLKM